MPTFVRFASLPFLFTVCPQGVDNLGITALSPPLLGVAAAASRRSRLDKSRAFLQNFSQDFFQAQRLSARVFPGIVFAPGRFLFGPPKKPLRALNKVLIVLSQAFICFFLLC